MARRTAAQREKDLQRTAEMYLKGWYQADIAEELGVTQGTISNDLKELYKRWQASALLDVDAAKARELARIDELERTYWVEWQASKSERIMTTTKAVEGGRKEAAVRKEVRLGDPRYLAGVQWCIERRCAIVGLDAPKRINERREDWRTDAIEYIRKGELDYEVLADELGTDLATELFKAAGVPVEVGAGADTDAED